MAASIVLLNLDFAARRKLSFEPGSAWQHSLLANDVATAVMTILNSPDNAVLEEINVRPLQHVVQKK